MFLINRNNVWESTLIHLLKIKPSALVNSNIEIYFENEEGKLLVLLL